jgi:predicted dehydrogenase
MVVVGSAGHSGLVLGELDQHPQVRLSAYAPSFPGESMVACAQYVAAHQPSTPATVHEDWRRMLDGETPDIVVVCGRYDLNGPVAIEAARRGCHIISEKPAAHSLDDVAELWRLIGEGDLIYASMLNMRYEPSLFTAHRLVREGTIGEPVLVSAQKSYRWGNRRPDWYAERAHYGSSMTWVGIHAFDFAQWVSGRQYTTVAAHHGNLVRKERPGCQDVATVMATLDNGGGRRLYPRLSQTRDGPFPRR